MYYKTNEIICNANNIQGMWTSLRQVLNKNKSHCAPAGLTPGGFNEFFSSVGMKLAEKVRVVSILASSVYTKVESGINPGQ